MGWDFDKVSDKAFLKTTAVGSSGWLALFSNACHGSALAYHSQP